MDNIINFLNLYDSEDNIAKGNYSVNVLVAPFHGTRVKVMLQLLAVPFHDLYIADAVLRYDARTTGQEHHLTGDNSVWRHDQLNVLDQKLNTNAPEDFYTQQKGNERNDIVDKFMKEDIYTRELFAFPERWLSFIHKLQNPARIIQILQLTDSLYPGLLTEKYHISSPLNSHDRQAVSELRGQLTAITYTGLTPEKIDEWKKELQAGVFLPDKLLQKYELLINLKF